MYDTGNFAQDVLYQGLVKDILDFGTASDDRTGTGTIRLFGKSLDFDLEYGFPLLQLKETSWKLTCNEFLWMVVKGCTDVSWLESRGHTFWNPWKREDGTIGKGYGYQFRKMKDHNGYEVDQVQNLISDIKHNPHSRRHIIELWNVADLEDMALPPCHKMTQWFVEGNKLSCLMYQRSVDVLVGLPVNIAFYALFTHVVAATCGLKPHKLMWRGGDVHIYRNHLEAAQELLEREPTSSPSLTVTARDNIDNYVIDDFVISGYTPLPAIKLPVAK